MFKVILLLVGLMLFSCSKEETEPSLTGENGGEISRYQIVIVDVGSMELTNQTYVGSFNNQPIYLLM